MNGHNFFNISQGFKVQSMISTEFPDTKVSPVKKAYLESENSPKKPWTPQRIILQQENESLKKYINELKESIEENEKRIDESYAYYDMNNNLVKKLRDLVDFVQMELNIYLEAKNSEFDKLQKEFEDIKLENEKLKERNYDLLRMWQLEKERVKRREKQLGMEQMKNKQIEAQMGMLEEAMMTK
ncbi:hypothetical protein PCANB_002663 [Pneumocystis canis]|nr:hypothetical protein PCANB_002663 [Pneumocystis canis]